MGCGDELMAMGQAETLWRATGRRVVIVGQDGAPRWSDLWRGHPGIAGRAEAGSSQIVRLVNGPGARPYLRDWRTWGGQPQATFTAWRAADHLGTMPLSVSEAANAARLAAGLDRFVIIEPHFGRTSSPNKGWGLERYQALVDAMPGVCFVQVGPAGTPVLRGTSGLIETPSFRDACAVMARAAAYIGPEGGLHHAAAVFRRPAVVLFGGFTSPLNTGYPFQVNLYQTGPESPCGRYAPCGHCAAAMAEISVPMVVAALAGVLERQEARCGR